MRRYRPDLVHSYGRSWGDWVDEYDAVMVESQYGEWTRWQNAHDAIQMLTKRSARLEARIQKLEDELFLLKADVLI